MAITHDALGITVQDPLAPAKAPISGHQTLDPSAPAPAPPPRHQTCPPPLGPQLPLLVTSDRHQWKPVQTCSLEINSIKLCDVIDSSHMCEDVRLQKKI